MRGRRRVVLNFKTSLSASNRAAQPRQTVFVPLRTSYQGQHLTQEMPARKESCTDARIEEELQEERPIYLVLMAAMLKLLFFIYDAIVYIPFKLLADPDEKVKVSNRVKVRLPAVADGTFLISPTFSDLFRR